MANYALLRIKHVKGNPKGPDEIAEEIVRAQAGVSWGRDAKVLKPSEHEKHYDEAIRRLDANCKAAKRRWEFVDRAQMLVRITDARKFKKRKPQSWETFLRVLEVKISHLELGVEKKTPTGIQVRGGLVTFDE